MSITSSTKSVSSSTQGTKPPILFCDVLDTLVADPFSRGMAQHLGYNTFQEFLHAKQPGTWPAFEQGDLTESQLAHSFFLPSENRVLDIPAMKQFLLDTYQLFPGIPELLSSLHQSGIQVHAFSNYPIWYQLIEESVALERLHGVPWTFVSAREGMRKPELRAYRRAAELAQAPVERCVMMDDREVNCNAALEAGYLAAVRFESAEQAATELRKIYEPYVQLS